MVKKVQLIRYLFLVSIILFGCSKETVQLSKYQQEQNSINELRKIVGNNGKFEVLPKNFNFNSSNIKSEFSIDSTTTRYMSIGEFKQLY
jgi:hypothetical protein